MCIRRIIARIMLLALSLVLCASVSAWGDHAIDETNFPDPVFRNYILSADISFDSGSGEWTHVSLDKNNDGKLSDSEIAAVKTISLSYASGVKSLKGIEYFTALTSLYCNNNELTSLDLSANTALVSLDCSNNQLTSLSLGNNTNLTYVYCYNNQLTSLSLDGYTNLTSLYCSYNKLTSLSLGGCTNLTSLYCSYNKLTNLDVSACTSLTSLSCNENQLTNLDVSARTSLTSLSCSNNKLTSLSLGGCTNLISLYCSYNQLTNLDVSACTSLTSLSCSNNKLTSLTLSGCTNLTTLSCYDNQITELDLRANTKLTEVSCYNNKLTSLNVNDHPSLNYLYCYSNDLSSLSVNTNTALKHLYCSQNKLDTLDVTSNVNLEDLMCGNNNLTTLDLSKNLSLDYLECSYNKLVTLKVDRSNNNSISMDYFRYLNCSHNSLTSLDVSPVSVDHLDCSYNELTALNVSKNVSLTHLDCSYNKLTALNVTQNVNVDTLYCGNNKLTTLDVSKNVRLQRLDCNDNQLRALDLSKNTRLTSLFCYNNHFTELDLFSSVYSSYAVSCYSQAVTLSLDTASVPNSHKLTFATLSVDATKFHSKAKNIIAKDFKGVEVNVSSDDSAFYFSSQPALMTYTYAVKVSEDHIVHNYVTISRDFIISGDTILSGDFVISQDFIISGDTKISRDFIISGDTKIYGDFIISHDVIVSEDTTVEGSVHHVASMDVTVDFPISIDATFFPDESFRNYVLSEAASLDKNQDGRLTNAEIVVALSIDVNGKNVASLKGIECFTALQSLDCSNNSLRTLDVSYNTALRYLYCSSNQLTAIDLSKNTYLTSLVCNSQTVTLASPDTTLNPPYIYSISLDILMASSDNTSHDVSGFISRLSSIDVKGHSAESVNYSFDVTAGRIYFDKKPKTLSYVYSVPFYASGNMDVAATLQGGPETIIYVPQISTDSLPDAAEGKSYSANISADGYPPLFWSISSGSLPSGLSINRTTGSISGTPDAGGQETQSTFTVYVSNDFGSTSKDFTLTVKTPPVITTSSLPAGQRDESYSASLTATGSTPITWSADNLPSGLSIASSSGAISGTPTQKGTFSVTIGASNVAGKATKTLSLVINPAASEIQLNDTNFPDSAFREYISDDIDSDGDKYLDEEEIASVTQLNLNAKNIADLTGIETFSALVSLDCSSNDLSGTLSLASNDQLIYLNCSHNSLTALDISNCTALATLFCGNNQIAALDLSANTSLTSFEGDPQARTIASPDVTTDSTYPYSFSPSALNLPVTDAAFIGNALSIDVKGHYDETVSYSSDSSAGIIYFENKPKTMSYKYATGQTGKYMNVTLTFGGSADNSRYVPQILTSELPAGISGVSYSADIEAQGYAPLFWSIASGTLPEGLSLDRTTGMIAGTPVASGDEAQFSFTVYVSNDFGNTSQDFALTVKTPPVIQTSSLADGIRNEAYSASLTATGSTPITWSADNLPQGLAISSDTGAIYGTPTQTGTFSVAITASNIAGYDSRTFSIVISAPSSAISISSDNFPDSAFRAYISENVDTNGDNYLDDDELNSVTYMDLKSRDISDLTGIEHFSALVSLDCSRNNITSLDVSVFPNLQYLYCQENMLSELDLSSNSSLVYLAASYNRLAALGLSANSLLRSMDCSPQSFTISADESDMTGYPYVIDLNAAKSALGLSISVTGFAANVSSLVIYTSQDQEITRSSDIEAGIIYLAEEPARLSYNYDTGAALDDPAMSVVVTILTSAHPQQDSDSGSDSGSGGNNTTPSNNSGSSSPSYNDPYGYTEPTENYNDVTLSDDLTPVSEDIASEDIANTSGDIAQVVSEDTGQAGEDGNSTNNNIYDDQGDLWLSAERISSTSAFMSLLININNGSEPPGKSYILEADLDISSIRNWRPIGTAANPFRGHFNGAGKTVTCAAPISMFGIINTDGIAVQNLHIRMSRSTNASASTVRASAVSESAGGLTTQLISGIIDNCTFEGTIYSEGDDSAVGGLVGELSGGTVRNCSTARGSEVSGGYSAGGIVGYVSAGEITGCSSNAEVSARYSGGIAGYSEAERKNINSNSFTLADYEVGSDAFGLALTPSEQNVTEGSYITAIEFDTEDMTNWSFVVEGNYNLGLTLRENAISGLIPPGTPSGRYTVTVSAFNNDGSRISGQAYINVTQSLGRIHPDSTRSNFMDYVFTLPSSVRSKLSSLFSGENIYQFAEGDIIARTWNLSDSDLNEISGMNMQVIMNLPAVRPSRSGVYVMRITLWEISAGTRISIQGLSGYRDDVNSSALDRMEYVLLDDEGREISAVPENKVIYAAMRLTSGETHRGTVVAPNDLKQGTIQAVTIDPTLLEKIAETVNISADELKMLSDDNIGDPQEPTQSMRNEIESGENRIIGKMNTLTVSQDGYYICKVTLSDDLYESIRGVKISDLNVYVLFDDENAEASEVRASFIMGLLNTWELLTLNGEKLEFGAKEFLMVGFLNAGTPFSVYLTKLLIALLLGGCDAGLGLAGLGALAVGTILLMRRRR